MMISPTMMVNNIMKVRRVMRLKFPIHIYIENMMDMKYLMICLGVILLIYGESKTKVEALIYPCGYLISVKKNMEKLSSIPVPTVSLGIVSLQLV